MEKLKLEVIKKVLMLDTRAELETIRENVSDAISRECDLDAKQEQEFKKWKENQVNV
jgi:hypothetical protein|tara:strand:+ start:211 stop:381 length:171 start_codon:yes stop_codon:yes gene_type:complete